MSAPLSIDQVGPYKATFIGTVRSEWIKLFTLRSTWWLLSAGVVINIGLCAMLALANWSMYGYEVTTDPNYPPPDNLGMVSEQVVAMCGLFGQLIFLLVAILSVTNEYSSGMIRATYTVGPRRSRVLAAKMTVVAGVGLVFFGLSLVVGWGVFYLIVRGVPGFDLSLASATSLRILGGFVVEMVLLAWLFLGLAAWLRSTAGTIGVTIGIIWILPLMLFIVNTTIAVGVSADLGWEPTGWIKWLSDAEKCLPTNAGGLVTQADMPQDALFGPWTGLGVLGIWTFVGLFIGFLATDNRDA